MAPAGAEPGDDRRRWSRARSSPTTASTGTSLQPAEEPRADAPPKHLEGLIIAAPGSTLAAERAAERRSPTRRSSPRRSTARATCRTARATTSRRPRSPSTRARWPSEIDALSVEMEGRAGIEARGMGAFAAVAQGSDEEPALITLRYEAAGRRARWRPDARLRRQGGDVRQRRHLAEARRENGRDEVRHVRRRRGRARRSPRSRACSCRVELVAVVGATENLPSGARGQAGRHRHGVQRQDDRGQQHRRRGPARARGLPRATRSRRARSGSSTWRRSRAR